MGWAEPDGEQVRTRLHRAILGAWGLTAGLALLHGCRPASAPNLVLYCSLDRPLAAPVIAAFTEETGLRVDVQYDTEAAKSTGLASRLRNEASHPRADVFWSSEVVRMTQLAADGVLAPYAPAGVDEIPPEYRDPNGYWTGFAGRFRVLVYDLTTVTSPPKSLEELTDERWRGRVTMANPLFGATATEAAVLFQVLGEEAAKQYYRDRKANQTRIVDGNSVAARLVAEGDAAVGQTDTDDAFRLQDEGRPLGIIFPDVDGRGALMIPNTVALIHAAPHPELGQQFIDFLIRPETELMLAEGVSRQLPLCRSLQDQMPPEVQSQASIRRLEVDYSRLAEDLELAQEFLRELFAD